MDSRLSLAVVLGVLQILLYPIMRIYGWYSRFWYADIILHLLSGVMIGAFWFWLVKKDKLVFSHLFLTTIMAAVFGSVLWEFWEFAGWRLIGRELPNYIPTLSDSLGDIVAGMAGAVILVALTRLNSR